MFNSKVKHQYKLLTYMLSLTMLVIICFFKIVKSFLNVHSHTFHDESLVATIYVMACCAITFFSTCRTMVGGNTYFRAARWTFYII